MRIGIIGGTGGMGRGFALRWSKNHDIIIGSRDASRAASSAREYEESARQAFGQIGGTMSGTDNASAARQSDVLFLSIPYDNIGTVCPAILPEISESCVVVSPIVPMTKTDRGFEFIPMMDGRQSSYALVSGHMQDKSKLVSAFHVISEKKLANPQLPLDYDIFVCGDDDGAVGTVNGLVREIEGLRPIYLGPGDLSYMAEIATPILLNAMIRNKIRNPGIKII